MREAHAAGVMELFYYSQFDIISGPLASLLSALYILFLKTWYMRVALADDANGKMAVKFYTRRGAWEIWRHAQSTQMIMLIFSAIKSMRYRSLIYMDQARE